jgi:ribose-phosphate pyrophosphokinase
MKRTLNLVYPQKSDIEYKISKFPDGQQDILITNPDFTQDEFDIEIKSRFNSFMDLELIVCATKALRSLNVKTISLYVPYILGARSDRKFQSGGTSYLRDVIAPILNAQEYEYIYCMDVHSDVAPSCINKLISDPNFDLVDFAIKDMCTWGGELRIDTNSFTIICPDDGASKKIFKVAKGLFLNNVIVCSKVRDIPTGQIIKTIVPDDEVGNIRFVIIDDICDGGRTFIEISKVLHKRSPECTIDLIVTHGIFSNGFNELYHHFRSIYCTNSVSDIDNAQANKFIKQLNIF